MSHFARLKRFVQIVIAGLLFCLPVAATAADPAEARTLLSMRAATVASALTEVGQNVVEVPGPQGFVQLNDKGGRYVVFMGYCSNGLCQLLQIRICRVVPGASAERATRWNNSEFFGRASLQVGGVMCVDDSYYAPDSLISMSALRHHVEGIVALADRAFVQFARE